METKKWRIRYVAYSDRIATTTVETDMDGTEYDARQKAYDEEGGGYSSDYICKIIDISEC